MMNALTQNEVDELDFQSLHSKQTGDKLLSGIDYSRPLKEYATAQEIASFIMNREKAQRIYSYMLQVNGKAVQDGMEKYLSQKEYLSSSVLKQALNTPLHYYYAFESGWKEEVEQYQKTASHFDLGTFLHMAILEPTRFSRVTVEPKHSMASTDGVNALIGYWEEKIESMGECVVDGQTVSAAEGLKAARLAVIEMELNIQKIDGKRSYLSILKKISGVEAVSETHKAIIDIVHRNYLTYGGGILPELLLHSKREISMYYTDPVTGLKVRIRPDAIQFKENIGCNAIISVKSTRAESLGHFYYQSAKLNYELSEGMYQEVATGVTGRDFNCTLMIMLQTIPPYGIALLVWDGEDIEIGKYKYHNALQTALECDLSQRYPGYDAFAENNTYGLISMKQPAWNAKELYPVDLED